MTDDSTNTRPAAGHRGARTSPGGRPLYRRGWFVALVVIFAIPAVALGWYLGSPLVRNRTVVEVFPTTAAPNAGAAGTAVGPAGKSAEPMARLTGSFVGADTFHHGSGTAAIYELEDGSLVLRFEGLDVTNGPDLHVIVSPVPEPQSRQDVAAAGYIDLGGLKGNRGDQNYELPAGFDLAGAGSIVIYCQPFHVIFATATLAAS